MTYKGYYIWYNDLQSKWLVQPVLTKPTKRGLKK